MKSRVYLVLLLTIGIFAGAVYSVQFISNAPFKIEWKSSGIIEVGHGTVFRKVLLYRENHTVNYEYNGVSYIILLKDGCFFYRTAQETEWKRWVPDSVLTKWLEEKITAEEDKGNPSNQDAVAMEQEEKPSGPTFARGLFGAPVERVRFFGIIQSLFSGVGRLFGGRIFGGRLWGGGNTGWGNTGGNTNWGNWGNTNWGNTGGNTNWGNTGGNTGGNTNWGNTGGNTGGNTNWGNTGGNTGGNTNTGNTGAATGGSSFENSVFDIVNRERARAGVPRLKLSTVLSNIARAHSKDMNDRRYFSHTTPEGLSASGRAKRAGVNIGLGENIIMGYSSPDSAMRTWMNSSGHRRNILSSGYRYIGVGFHQGRSMYGTQVFSSSTPPGATRSLNIAGINNNDPNAAEVTLHHDFEAAKAESRQNKKPLLAILGVDWCGYCRKLKSETIGNRSFIDRVSSRYVIAYLSDPNEFTAIPNYSGGGIPQTFVYDSSGKLVKHQIGYIPDQHLSMLEQLEK